MLISLTTLAAWLLRGEFHDSHTRIAWVVALSFQATSPGWIWARISCRSSSTRSAATTRRPRRWCPFRTRSECACQWVLHDRVRPLCPHSLTHTHVRWAGSISIVRYISRAVSCVVTMRSLGGNLTHMVTPPPPGAAPRIRFFLQGNAQVMRDLSTVLNRRLAEHGVAHSADPKPSAKCSGLRHVDACSSSVCALEN